MKHSNITRFYTSNSVGSQPVLEYNLLKKNKCIDLRSKIKISSTNIDIIEHENDLSYLDEKKQIPLPGLLIQYENSDSQTAPPVSDWIASHGPYWNNYIKI